MNSPHRPSNRLARESSPYLLQHAHNPVDWHPWGPDALERARAEDRPVFLSIGYSTCHWCHVMERESFEDEAIAELLNAHFVAVKVDREERPDVDAVYMAAVQAMGGQGGWPLSVFLTPDGRPFFGGTYFPPEDRHGRPGFPTVLRRVAELWATRRDELLAGAEQLTNAVRSMGGPAEGSSELGAATLERAERQFAQAFDAERGGFGHAPKFPRAFALSFLLRRHARDGGDAALEMVVTTLEAIRRGGVHDHLGGGFHRYSTDADWLLPHFEKMLYDQALLSRAFVEAFQATGRPEFRDAARGAFDYVLRDLRDPSGAFHSAEDADSEGEEGKFYVFTRAELDDLFGREDAELFAHVYAVEEAGNFFDEATRRRTGANVLHLRKPLAEHAAELGEPPEAFAARIGALRERLLEARSRRVRPHLDDKVLADWNGLMIGALALGGAVLGEERYVRAASEAADAVLGSMRRGGVLLHRLRGGEVGIPGFLEDYAFLADGLCELYQATFEPRYLGAALELARDLAPRFGDPRGGLALSARDGERLIAEPRELYDGALPSGNSAAALALVRLGRLAGDAALEEQARELLGHWSGTIERYPMGYPYALTALDFLVGPTREVVVAGEPGDAATAALVHEVRSRFLPRTLLALRAPGAAGRPLDALVPSASGKQPLDGRPAAYVCQAWSCRAPVTSAEELGRALDAPA